MKTEQQPIPSIQKDLSWQNLSELPFSYRLRYWLDFLSSLDPDKVFEIDRAPLGSLRYSTTAAKLSQKIEAVKALKPIDLPEVIYVVAGIDLPQKLVEAAPEARQTSKYYVLSEANTSDISRYYVLTGAFPETKADKDSKAFVKFVAEVMPESSTRDFLSEQLRNGNIS